MNTWFNFLKVSKIVGILLLLILGIGGGVLYTITAYQNWLEAKDQVTTVISHYEGLNFGNNTEQKYGRLNETIDKRNEIDRTFFNALRDGFFGLGAAISLATFLLSLDIRGVREERDVLLLTPDQFNRIIETGGVEIGFAANLDTDVRIGSNNSNS